ncbi:hypothetical protein F4809DRAFT_646880 [Biscogniauxia mediterranea]|nr:hypothetical protein F4809DRAFT_646880 [Biscogniauxia mediterranea]
MARSCAHSFQMIKSDNTLVQFSCYVCQAGPSWFLPFGMSRSRSDQNGRETTTIKSLSRSCSPDKVLLFLANTGPDCKTETT